MARNFLARKSCVVYFIITLKCIHKSTASSAWPSVDQRDALGEICEANNIITRKCASMGLYTSAPISAFPTSDCKAVPDRNTDSPPITFSMNEMLFNGVKKMDNQKASLDADGIFSDRKAVFVLGNTGSGKTTATQIMAGDLNRLHASFTKKGRKLVIFDDDNRIGAPTTKSRTLIPEYVIHPESGLAFWDCPGFDDNRGPEVDIAAMYFVKHALDSTTSAKFLLTVTHSSVQPGNDRLDFDLLATHVTKLFSNVAKLQPAIGLVVTKLGSYSSASGEYLSDEEIILQIREFLEKYVETKRNDMANCDNEVIRLEHASKIKLVEGILGMGSGENNLYFVRSPENCGVLGEMHLVQDTRTKLAEMIGRLEYVDVTPQDFRFTVKAETRIQLETEWIPENKEQVSESISSSAMQIWTQFEHTFYDTLGKNKEESISLLNHTIKIIGGVLNRNQNVSVGDETSENDIYSEAKSISNQIYNLYIDLSFEMKCTELASLRHVEKQHNFFQVMLNQNGKKLLNWTQPFLILYNELVILQSFYKFCHQVEIDIATYSNQVMLGQLKEEMIIPQFGIWEADVLNFLIRYNISQVSPAVFTLWKEIGWTDRHFLETIMTEAVPNISWKCVNSMSRKNKMRLIVVGNYVKLSDVINQDKWQFYCNNYTVAELSVVALETVYLDADLNYEGKELYISIISPVWRVVLGDGERVRNITLDGLQPTDPGKASDGANYVDKGKNGAAGLPGGNAGSFFGVYSIIIGVDSLFISANGGNGGKGQDGGNGHFGKSAENLSDKEISRAMSVERSKPTTIFDEYDEDIVDTTSPFNSFTYRIRIISGKNGSIGSDGGNGGSGGIPGNAGSIQAISLAGSQIIIPLRNKSGLPGVPGKAGSGGKGGKHGNDYSCKMYDVLVWTNDCKELKVSNHARPGNDGKPGEYVQHLTIPPVATVSNWRGILEYKTSFYENPPKPNFLKLIDSNQEIQSYLKTIYFAKEVEFLESQFYQMWNAPANLKAFLDYYDSLQERLNSYFESVDNSQLADEEKYGISLLQAIVTSKTVGMRRSENRLNVLDTAGYFTTLAEQLDILQKEKQEKMISEQSSSFRATLQEKIQEAEMLIDHTVQPAIVEAQNELKLLNDDLLQEVNQFIKEAEEEVKNRTEAKKKFESLMWMRPLMGIMKTAGTLCSFLGPKGAVVGAVINVGASALGEFAPPVNPSQTKGRNIIPEAANQIYSIGSTSRAYYTNKINNIQGQIDIVVKEAKNLKDESMAAEMNGAAENTILSLSGFKLALTSPDGTVNEVSLRKYEVEVDKSAQKMADVTKQVADAQDEMREAGKDMLKNEQNLRNVAIILQAAQNVQGIVTSIIDNEAELRQWAKFVEEAQKNVEHLKNLKNKFYEELFPEMDIMNQALRHATEGLPGKSIAALSVKKWKVNRVLKMVRGYLQQFTNGFKTQEKFQLSFDALDEVLALLMDMYEHIERYEEQKQLAEYIANINLLSGNKNNIQDEELKLTLERLEFNVEANLFYQEYQRAMHTFKQWVFPFASNYLTNESPWGTGKLPTNLSHIIYEYAKQVQNLDGVLKRYKTSTVNGDEILMLITSTSGLVASKPFYVWSNAEWKDSIEKLLKGEIIHLKADVDLTRQDVYLQRFFDGKSAIKFKTINVNITANNESRQVELNKNLNKFHIRMTHSGVSTYKVMGRKYVMFDQNQSLEYSFQETAKGYITRSMTRHKIEDKNTDYLMSPYTWWTLQMVPVSSMYSFKLLSGFYDNVDLELVGEGIYLNELKASRETLEKLDLTSYYEELYDGDEFEPKNIMKENNCVSVD